MKKVIINSDSRQEFFLDYICFLEATKTSCKALHWGIVNTEIRDKRGAHIYLDEFLEVISSYQDMIVEVTQGIIGNYITPTNIKGKEIQYPNTPHELCQLILDNVFKFYEKISNAAYVGIKSETETFIKDIQKYNELFIFCE